MGQRLPRSSECLMRFAPRMITLVAGCRKAWKGRDRSEASQRAAEVLVNVVTIGSGGKVSARMQDRGRKEKQQRLGQVGDAGSGERDRAKGEPRVCSFFTRWYLSVHKCPLCP